tara:strand:- start:53 stop:1822 length:1770 start_codon:yes stop_codon:yes gene_type:complete
MGIVFAIKSSMKKNLLFFLLLGAYLGFGQTPMRFESHRVKKGETLSEISTLYKISEEQLLEYNPLLERIGIKRKMSLRIPIFPTSSKPQDFSSTATKTSSYPTHQVLPKETKWRLAYEYGMTLRELDSLNPQIVEGLKIGQEIRVKKQEIREVLPEKDSLFNYYKVLPAEGYYRIEKKLGVSQSVLDSLNPSLNETGLQVGMILRIPDSLSGRLKIENDLLVERINLLDSTLPKTKMKLAVLLPFKANEIEFDSIEDTKRTLEARNLHTISIDFYTGVLFALERATQKGIEVELTTFDTENQLSKLGEIVESKALEDQDFIVGPLIPYNFDYVSSQPSLKKIPKIAPLSTRSVAFRKNVVQSVTEEKDLRDKMYEYLEKQLDTTQNVVIVADSTNRKIEKELLKRFPWAIKIRPEKADYIIQELADSLLIDSLPNKIILETQSFPLIASALSQISAQNTKDRDVQVFTTYRSNAYDNENLTRKTLGAIQFSYPTGFKPLDKPLDDTFVAGYITSFGKPPNKEALRAYDLVLDAVLRTAYAEELQQSLELGETEYQSNRFYYRENENESLLNQAFFILQHQGYEIIEIKE